MRSKTLLIPLLAAVTLPALARADDATAAKDKKKYDIKCTLTAEKGDRVVQNQDMLVDAGEKVKDAVVLHGDVLVRKGAVVEKVVALDGNVILEPGARVSGDVVALGGDVRVSAGAEIGGDLTALGGHLQVDSKASVKGKRVALGGLEIDGEDLAQKFIKEALSKEQHCKVERK